MTHADVKELRLRLDNIERTQRDTLLAMKALCEAMSGRTPAEVASQESTSAFARMYVRQHGLLSQTAKRSAG